VELGQIRRVDDGNRHVDFPGASIGHGCQGLSGGLIVDNADGLVGAGSGCCGAAILILKKQHP
jgi:hypothetical protein